MLTTWKKLFKVSVITVLVLAAALVTVKIIRRTFFPKPAPAMARTRLRPGAKISLPEVQRAGAQRTLILYLSKNCGYCKASVPFYRTLVQETSGLEGVRLLAMFPQEPEEGRAYLNEMGLSGLEVGRAESEQLATLPTPTLLLIDNQGIISGMWVGRQRVEGEANIVRQLRASAQPSAERDAKWSRWEN